MNQYNHRAATDELCVQIYFTAETDENTMKGTEDQYELKLLNSIFFYLFSSKRIWTSLLKQDPFTWDAIL